MIHRPTASAVRRKERPMVFPFPIRRWSETVRAALLVSATIAVAACVEREETIQVQADGRVDFALVHRSDSAEDLFEGDAVPSLRGGWIVTEHVEQDPSGREVHSFTAEATFAPGKPLPSSLADLGDPDADLALRFPTTLRIEKRGRETWYHFARVYEPRVWEQVEFKRRAMEQSLEGLQDRTVGEWSDAERANVVLAYLEHDFAKRQWFARQAYLKVMPDKRQDGWLAVDAALNEHLHSQDIATLGALLVSADEEARDAEANPGRAGARPAQAALVNAIARFEPSSRDAMQDALRRDAGFSGEQVNVFLQHYQRARRAHEVTEDLNDDRFRITVEMPGRIVASNAASASDHQAIWDLKGEDFRDRRLELLVSSVVGRE
jgi:hypothetical protein